MRMGYCQILRARDRAGRRIYVHFFRDAWNCLSLKTKMRILTYYVMDLAQNDPECLQKGAVGLFWFHCFRIRVDRFVSEGIAHSRLCRSLPMTVGALHCFLPSSTEGSNQQNIGSFAAAKIISSVPRQYIPQIRIHHGTYATTISLHRVGSPVLGIANDLSFQSN